MKILITGLNGTLAPHLARLFKRQGYEILAWDRAKLDPSTAEVATIDQHLEALSPEGIVHLGMGSELWAGAMAGNMAKRGLPFVFSSTAMVFDAGLNGPHHVGDARTARDDYGLYKIRCENAVLGANPSAVVARIGYQIDCDTPTGNNMVAHLIAQGQAGPIRASQSWVPATSQMHETAAGLGALFGLAQRGLASGVHHLDSNAQSALAYPQIVAWIGQRLNLEWTIQPTNDYLHDQRLLPAIREDSVLLPDLATTTT